MNKLIDKPIAAKIILNLVEETYNGEKFIGLSGTLYQQRLIFAEPRELRKNSNQLELSVIFLDKDSFKNWLKHPQIIEYWTDNFEQFLKEKPITIEEHDVVFEIDEIYNCSCDKPDFLLLYGRRYRYSNELNCGNCLGNFSFNKIPLIIEIENWQSHHERVYQNWLDSSFLEGSATRQLKNHKKGKLYIEGQRIRKELSEHFNIPVYLEYFTEEPDIQKSCPLCGATGIKSGLKKPNKICKKCNTAFDYTEK